MEKQNLTIRDATDKDQEAWDAIVGHPLQSWAWGEFRKAMGIDVVRRVVTCDKKIVDGFQLTFHKIPHTPWTIGYFPKGPEPTEEMFTDLREIGNQKHALFIQLEPNIVSPAPWLLGYLATRLLRPAHHPLFTKNTFVLDLTKSEDDLLKDMHSKTRYNIKVAQKYGVTVQEDNSDAAFEQYLRLTLETTGRQNFYAHNRHYHETQWKTLKDSGMAKLFTATYQKETLVTWLLFIWKNTLYYPYGASSRDRREVMAPTLMLWEVAKWAKKQKLKKFDLWGAIGPNPDPKDPWYGFHRFKEGFHPELVEFVGSYDLVISPVLYQLYKLADKLRWIVLKLKRK